jgi:hypothetical protein
VSRLIWIAVWGLIMANGLDAKTWDTQADTWVATDALGRVVSTYETVGDPRPDRFVGVFYFLWLGEHGQTGPWDVTKILAANPGAMNTPTSPPWGPMNTFHHWGESQFGYYLSDDPWVLRKHAQMLSDAGVDVVIFDVTNQATYQKNYTALCEVWTQVRKEGGRTPQIAFLTPFWDPPKVVRKLYDDFYSKNLYKDLWFIWKGKPLIMADPGKVDPELKGLFTYRKPQPDYFQGPTGPNEWGWLEKYPQHIFYDAKNRPEQMTVGVGQNTEGTRCCAFTVPDALGRSWHNGKRDTRRGAVNLGLNFAEQWDRALKIDPEFIFITGWNEWVATRYEEFAGIKQPVVLVDQFTQEYSRDVEPMRGGHTDSYYYQMVDYIRRFKGARELPISGSPARIRIDGRFDDWRDVSPEYRDDIGDTMHRDHPGWGSAGRYTNDTGRNDIILTKVACDAKNVYFYVRTKDPVTPHTDPNWMLLLIRLKRDGPNVGWNGYRYIVNRTVPNDKTTCIESSSGGWNWNEVGKISYRVKGCEMEIALPRRFLIPPGILPGGKLEFDFKWADNTLQTGEITELITNGDTAPNGRFAYRFTQSGVSSP